MTTIRNYQGKDVDMLTTCATIIENAIANAEFLNSKHTSWTHEFFSRIKERIDNAFRDFLGIDNASQMREATQIVVEIQSKSLNDLAELKVQIEEDFKSDKKNGEVRFSNS
jgi:signal transduction protein with GAF and PtsI domain